MMALILCAGYGKRLRPLTWFKPKPMVKVHGRPMLEHIVDYLHDNGVYKIIVNTHYKPTKIMKHFGTELLYTYEKSLLGEAGTIESIVAWVKEPLVVMNGDTLTNLDLVSMYKMSSGNNIASYDGDIYTGCKILFPGQDIEKLYKYRQANIRWQDMGTLKSLFSTK